MLIHLLVTNLTVNMISEFWAVLWLSGANNLDGILIEVHVWYGCNHSVHNQKTCYFIILAAYLMITNVTLLHFELWALHACLLSYFGLSQYLVFPCCNVFFVWKMCFWTECWFISLNKLYDHHFHFSMLSLLMWSSSLRVALQAIDYSVSRYITQLLLHTTNQSRPNC